MENRQPVPRPAQPLQWTGSRLPQLDVAILGLYTTAAEAAPRIAASRHAMGAPGIPADEAFDMLVEHSQRENIKLREVAERLVARVIQPKTRARPAPLTAA